MAFFYTVLDSHGLFAPDFSSYKSVAASSHLVFVLYQNSSIVQFCTFYVLFVSAWDACYFSVPHFTYTCFFLVVFLISRLLRHYTFSLLVSFVAFYRGFPSVFDTDVAYSFSSVDIRKSPCNAESGTENLFLLQSLSHVKIHLCASIWFHGPTSSL